MSIERGGDVPTPTTVELPYSSSSTPTQEEPVLRRDGNVTYITKPEGKYTVIYGIHIISQNPDQLPQNTTGLVLESADFEHTTDNAAADGRALIQNLKEAPQYNNLFLRAEEKRIPIFVGDLTYHPFGNQYLANDLAIFGSYAIPHVAEFTLGAILLTDILSTRTEKKMKRRNLLKAIAATYLVSPIITQAMRSIPVADSVTAPAEKISNRLHPEAGLFIESLREVVTAYKEERFMNYKGNTPHLATVWGSAHASFEDGIVDSLQSKYTFLERFAPILKHIIVPETFYTFSEFAYDGISWELSRNYIMPELKALMD